ncbi:class I SAM-dependent methyltransferase [Pelosinus propionicus]|uniref:Methyltransferase domain-containing protein n=1 Tax=Pelosinus propionicus DSM 13327 TaxID=1123291 RepID=A0A1I4HSZ6_9FIRM|nr:class I SAM-dependent methyltransferase [Pelosinus propionicus]SFL45262.1 Methyltransferase domain-containing protein [Pelosinus propionicus DSM 13327]
MKNELDEHVIAYEGKTIYDFDNEILLNWYPRRIIELTKETDSILELGLGHGFTAHIFSKIYKKYCVLEGSPAVIKNFRKNFSNCELQIIETYFESFKSNEKFDVIVMGFILEHVENPVRILNHFKQFLSPNGKIFIAVPNAEAMNRRLGRYAGFLADMQELSQNDLDLGHKRFYTVDSLKKEMKDTGFSIERIEGIYLKPFTTSQILSLNLDKKVIEGLCEMGINYPELSCGILAEGKIK